jgi:SAM-dependent methyltransferase
MALAQFVREYRTVRRAEGWGSADSAYYRALPYRDLSGRFDAIWRIRARSYDTFVDRVLRPLERDAAGTPLRVLDLGAGNGWLSFRMSQRGHTALALDVLEDAFDGLGATRQYAQHKVEAALAEFDHLPVPAHSADLVVFNASLHYSTDYCRTLRETLRVLVPRGTLVILDSPMYSDPSSGTRMVQEREARFLATYGFASNALACEHFLTPDRLRSVGSEVGIRWCSYLPKLDARTAMERRINGLRARREPARFPVLVGHPQ